MLFVYFAKLDKHLITENEKNNNNKAIMFKTKMF